MEENQAEGASEQVSVAKRPGMERWAGGLLAVMIIAIGAVLYSGPSTANEQGASDRLKELGAIVVMDGSRSHVASVNLSTLKSSDSLAEALVQLRDLPYLTALDISHTTVSDEALVHLENCSRLTSLTANGTSIGDAGCGALAGLTQLAALHLAGTDVSSTGLKELGNLSELKVLNLSETQVTSGLEPIASLPKINWLLLSGLDLAQGALAPLGDCTTLSRLTLTESKYPEADLSSLQDKNAGVSIDR